MLGKAFQHPQGLVAQIFVFKNIPQIETRLILSAIGIIVKRLWCVQVLPIEVLDLVARDAGHPSAERALAAV